MVRPIFGALVLLLGTGSVQALLIDQIDNSVQTVPELTRFGDWSMSCLVAKEDQRRCQLQPVTPEGTPAVTTIIVPAAAQKDANVLILRTPLAVHLPGGIQVSVDGRKYGRLAFQACDVNGCVAPVPLSGRLGRAMRAGGRAELVIQQRDGAITKTPLSLMGISAGLKALKTQD